MVIVDSLILLRPSNKYFYLKHNSYNNHLFTYLIIQKVQILALNVAQMLIVASHFKCGFDKILSDSISAASIYSFVWLYSLLDWVPEQDFDCGQ